MHCTSDFTPRWMNPLHHGCEREKHMWAGSAGAQKGDMGQTRTCPRASGEHGCCPGRRLTLRVESRWPCRISWQRRAPRARARAPQIGRRAHRGGGGGGAEPFPGPPIFPLYMLASLMALGGAFREVGTTIVRAQIRAQVLGGRAADQLAVAGRQAELVNWARRGGVARAAMVSGLCMRPIKWHA